MTAQVFRLAARRLLRQPAFAIAAIVTLALGIGANLAIFAFVQSVLLSPINASEPDRLVRVTQGLDPDNSTPILSWLTYIDARDSVAAVDLAAHGTTQAQIGLALAFPAGYLAAGALSSWLFGVSPFAPGLYAVVAAMAAWFPARRASRIDPVLALRA
ncbi:MAG TPA: hypothetical protein VMM93_06630 [Vicinamibacterales bacterium]|nr:hypothetical protein [Vicinamibacterales bacterium]